MSESTLSKLVELQKKKEEKLNSMRYLILVMANSFQDAQNILFNDITKQNYNSEFMNLIAEIVLNHEKRTNQVTAILNKYENESNHTQLMTWIEEIKKLTEETLKADDRFKQTLKN